MKDTDDDFRQSVLHRRFAFFLKKWAPKGEDREFEADLYMLTRTIHDDAAKPFTATLSAFYLNSPINWPTTALNSDREWRTMESAPQDGTIIEVAGRYPEATAGYPRYVGFRDGKWVEYSRFEPQEIIPWRWRPRTDWPQEDRQR